ncbi:MAG: glycoside hydrolase family 5 protein [Gemmataceae bacterium]|nr:glycoside hydrolase family 5 protein [Gemmata sp.]MDW8199054.1 glycoside hydrolase family 5 protein [Gemmataceae bacterium]
MRRFLLALFFAAVGHSICNAQTPAAKTDIFAVNRSLGRGINLGNALEAPQEGDWGLKLEARYFPIIAAAGFQTVRVPIKWSAHAAPKAPYTIDPQFFQRIDWVLEQAAANKLNVVLNVHHYDEMDKQPEQHLPRLIAIWEQIAQRYQNQPASVVFELYNEPHDKFVDDEWNKAIPQLLKAVRTTNPTRAVIVGPPFWNGIWALPKLKLPDDPNLIVTVHYYEPFRFTHQGASWASDDVKKLSGIRWQGTAAEMAELRQKFDQAAEWAKKHKRPIFLGEFGAYEKADMDSRARWTAAVVREAEARGFSWAYWEFAAGFGAYDRTQRAWREPLLKALIPSGK